MLGRRAHESSNADLQLLEQALGFAHQPLGLLQDRALRRLVRPATCAMIDWMHTWVANGIANWEFWCFLKACKAKCGIGFNTFNEFVGAFTLPRHEERLQHTFGEKRERSCTNADAFKAGASEILSLYPIMRIFIRKPLIPSGSMDNECASFQAMCDVLDA